MQYAEYRNKMLKLKNALGAVKRFRALIILACALSAALVTTLLCIKGIVYETVPCPQEIVYGESLPFRAKAVMGGVTYQYSADGESWSEAVPVGAGSYKVRSASKSVAGKPRYGKVHSFTVLPREIEVRAADTAVYGDDPELSADLAFSDSISCGKFIYGDRYAAKTDVLPDRDGVKIYGENGADVTSSYIITTVKSDITISKRAITVAAASAEKEYDGAPLTADGFELLEETTLAAGDNISINGCNGSVTDAGEKDNAIVGEVKIYNKDGMDVTARYNLKTACGTLTVLKRAIKAESGSAEKEYDGKPLYCLSFSDDGRLVSGHSLRVSSYAKLTDAGERENALEFAVRDIYGRDKTANYEIKLSAGTLTVSQRKITVEASDKSFVYNGGANSFGGYKIIDGSLAAGHAAKAVDLASITDVGTVENHFSVTVSDGAGADVTKNYSVTVIAGTLTVTAKSLTVVSADGSFVYDGKEHGYNGCTPQGLAANQTVKATSVAKICDVGSCGNEIDIKVFAGDRDVTFNYDITYIWGTLSITPRPVTVTADGAEKVYDGAALTCATLSADNLVAGHKVTGQTYGSGTDAGVRANSVVLGSVEIRDESGRLVTYNYAITLKDGVLKITERPITVISADGEFTYDGDSHHNADYKIASVSGVSLVYGHTAALQSCARICDAGEKENVIEIKIFAGGTEKTANYRITYDYGTLKVTPRPVTVTTGSDTKVYDGLLLQCWRYTLTSALSPALVKDHQESVYFTGGRIAAGASDNDAFVEIRSAAGGDKTANYDVTVKAGTLTVTKRPVTVISFGGSWIYDGEVHTRTAFKISDDAGTGLVSGETAELLSATGIIDVGTAENVITVKIISVFSSSDYTENYEISYGYGSLSVTPRPVTITADGAEKEYDGKPLTCGTVSGDNLVYGHTASAQTLGSQTDVGESENSVKAGTVVIRDGNSKDVTRNYSVTLKDGVLKVTLREITVKAGDLEKMYDGDPLTFSHCEVVPAAALLYGHALTAKTLGSQTDAGSGVNSVIPSSVKITDADDRDVSCNYNISFEDGFLTVTPRPITVTAQSAEKEYDGAPLTCPKYNVMSAYDPALVKGHTLTALISGSRTETGESANAVESVTVTSGSGGDVTGNYAIIAFDGVLKVTGRKLTVTSADGEFVYDGNCRYIDKYTFDGLLSGHAISREEIEAFKNAGSYENKLTVIVYGGGEEVTANYDIQYIYGTVTVRKREVHITTADGEFVYDGEAHSAAAAQIDSDSPYGLVEGHAFAYTEAAEITSVGEKENRLTVSVYGGGEVTQNYDLHLSFGTLKVTKRPVTVTYKYDDIYFTGEPLNLVINCYARNYFTSLSDYPLLKDAVISVTVLCDEYLLGEATLYFQDGSARITDMYDGKKDLTDNYEITLAPKQVRIQKRAFTAVSNSAEKVYDGAALTCEEYSLRSLISQNVPFVRGATVSGHVIECETAFTGSQTVLGESLNTFTVVGFKVCDGAGNDLTYGYEALTDYGSLCVTEFGSLYVKTGSAEKIYDGAPLTCGYYSAESTLSEGYTYEITVTGSQTEVGTSYNAFDVAVYSPQGNDVTAGARIVTLFLGTLRVLEKLQTGGDGAGDLDLSGDIGGGGSGQPPEPRVALRIKSDTSGQIYMRLLSYGGYTGRGWSPANPYGDAIGDRYGMNYLTGFALGGAGKKTANMQVEVLGSYYYLPYYLSADADGYAAQRSDVIFTGDANGTYSVNYYPYNYLADGAVKQSQKSVSAIELTYRQFVYENYLVVPESSASYLKTVISSQGFDVSDGRLVAKIAEYVRRSATYNLNYDTALDSESDAVVSFLRDYKEGVCRHYASAATLLYRMAGIPARYTIGYTGEAVAGEWAEITAENAHAWVEIYIDGTGWVQIEVTGSSDSGYGEINLGEIAPADVTKEYDGKPLTANRLAETGALKQLLSSGFTYKAAFGGSQTAVGTGESFVESLTLYDPDGKPVLDGVSWTSGYGKLTVVKSGMLIIIHLYYLGAEYDGLPHSLNSGDYFTEGLPAGFTVEFDPSAVSVTDAGGFDWNEIKALPLKLCNSYGYDVTGNYNIIFSFESEKGCAGEGIDISRRAITIVTQSAEKEYDGSPLTCGECRIAFGSLAGGHTLNVAVTGSLTDAGTAQNTVGSCKITDAAGRDVTGNYSINFKLGTLTVFD